MSIKTFERNGTEIEVVYRTAKSQIDISEYIRKNAVNDFWGGSCENKNIQLLSVSVEGKGLYRAGEGRKEYKANIEYTTESDFALEPSKTLALDLVIDSKKGRIFKRYTLSTVIEELSPFIRQIGLSLSAKS